MAKIKKRSGEMQEFDRRKLEESVRRAGASDEVAKRVAERVKPSEGTSTEELRRQVSQELKRENEVLSGAYAATRRLRAKSSSELTAGVARVHEELLKRHGLESGHQAHVAHSDKRAELRVEATRSAQPTEILMSKSDLDRLGASEGSRVSVRLKA